MVARPLPRSTVTVADLADLHARAEAARATARALVARGRVLLASCAVVRAQVGPANDRAPAD